MSAVVSYDLNNIRAYCASLGMPVDEVGLVMAETEAGKYGLTQEQFDAGLRLHAWRVKFLFNPKSYSWGGRIALAIYFLTGLGAKS